MGSPPFVSGSLFHLQQVATFVTCCFNLLLNMLSVGTLK